MTAGRTAGEIHQAFSSANVASELRGNPAAEVKSLSSPDAASPGSLIFVERSRDIAAAIKSLASVIVLPIREMPNLVSSSGGALIGVADVRKVMPILLSMFDRRRIPPPGVHSTAALGKRTVLGKNVSIGPHVAIGEDCSIGDGAVIESHVSIGAGSAVGAATRIFPGARIYDGVRIGSRCIIHSGAVIGSDGYGYVSGPAGHEKVPQIGGVKIEDDVELGANVTIDRGTVGDTVVGCGTKIDNLVHIAHNVQVGQHCLIIAQCGVAGSAKLGHWTVLAAQSGVAGHIVVGDRAMIGAKSGVTKSIRPGQAVSGFPARPHPEEKRIKVSMGRLPDLVRDVTRLKASILRLSKRLSAREQMSHTGV